MTRDAMTQEEHRVSLSAEASRYEGGPHSHDAWAQFQITADDDGSYEDTIELSLTPEGVLALSRAAEQEDADAFLAAPRPPDVPGIQIGNAEHRSAARFGRSSLVLASLVLGVAIGAALGLAVHLWPHVRTATIKVPISTPARATPLPAAPPVESVEPPVEFRNPFDRSEVFEFPPGTSADEARESVATVLLQRARARLGAESKRGNRPTPNSVDDRAQVARNSESAGT